VREEEMKGPEVEMVSGVSGGWLKEEEARRARYWGRQVSERVRYWDGVKEMSRRVEVMLEVGGGRGLSDVARQVRGGEGEEVKAVASMGRVGIGEREEEEGLAASMGRIWESGVEVDWEAYQRGRGGRRVELPSYAFERQRFWIDPPAQDRSLHGHQVVSGKNADIADWFYLPIWKRSMPLSVQMTNRADEKFRWLLLVDECGLGDGIAARLKQLGHDVTTVATGDRFAMLDSSSYIVNPDNLNEYDLLFNALRDQNKLPQRIVHLWTVSANDEPHSDAADFEKCQYVGFYSLISLVKSIENHHVEESIEIIAISTGTADVTGDEPLYPARAAMLGACKVIPQEYAKITCRSIDVTLSQTRFRQDDRLVEKLVAEIACSPGDAAVAYRSRHRWVQGFEAVRFNEGIGYPKRLRDGGVVFITGGLGRMGLEIAAYLARSAKAKLALVSRTALPRREEWQRWVETHDEADTVSRKLRRLLAIEQLGAELLIISADVADEQQLEAAIEQTVQRYGALHAVIHAAGASPQSQVSLIRETSLAKCAEQFKPKVLPLYALARALKGRAVDFCLLQSSLAAVLGGLGFAAYSAANIFLDAFAHAQSRTGALPWISVNWDGWQFAERKNADSNRGGSTADFAMTAEEGVGAFERILQGVDVPQIAVSTGDLQARINAWIKLETLHGGSAAQGQEAARVYERPALANAFVAPEGELEGRIAAIWSEILGVEKIGICDDFFELGGHSLLGIQLISRLRETFEVEVSPRSFFDNATVLGVAVVILQAQAEFVEDRELDRMLTEIEQLSEVEAGLMTQARWPDAAIQ
jgi:acyl transferase domain-containing protein